MRAWGWMVAAGCALALAACEQKPADPLAAARAACNIAETAPADRVAACTKLLDEGALAGPVRAAALAARSEAHLAANERTPALRDAEAALALDPENLEAAYSRAIILIDSGQLDAADPLVARMIAANYRLDDTQMFKGRIALARSQYEDAIATFNTVLTRNPNAAAALALRGRADEKLGHIDAAKLDYDHAISADATRSTEAYKWRCWLGVRAKADLATLRPDAEAAVRAEPNSVEAHNCLGIVQLRNGEWADAKNSFDAALAAQPGDPIALFGRGVARRRSGDAAGSDDLNQAHEFNPHIRADYLDWGVQTF